MQSEIKFLLELVLNHKLPPPAKKLCLERIGEVEEYLLVSIRPRATPQLLVPGLPAHLQQKSAAQLKFEMEQANSPNILNEIAAATAPAPIAAPVPSGALRALPPAGRGQEIDKETGRPMIRTGNGTKGPRKF